jgi:large subunit ribosomal protein L10
MALRLEDKKALVKEVNAVAGDSVTAVAAEYRGLSVAEMTALRKEARDAGVYMRVVKNTLARRAVKGTQGPDSARVC